VRHAHVIGAGLAGLAAAMALVERGVGVTLYEAGPAAGGRCRSYFDRELGCRIDNGNHLVLSGNTGVLAYLRQIGAAATLVGPSRPRFPFIELPSGTRWVLAPSDGRIPWWIFARSRRVPGTRARDYLRLLALRRAGAEASVAAVLDDGGPLYRRLLEPLAIAALNTAPEDGLARLLARVVQETLMRGGAACRPMVPRVGLSETFVDPALDWLARRGARLFTGRRIGALAVEGGRVTGFADADGTHALGADEGVLLAVPPNVAVDLLPGLTAPDAFCPILNVHFRADAALGFVGVIGGTAQWVFGKPGVASVTISAAGALVDLSAEAIAARVWPDVRAALDLAEPMPAFRVVKERRATFAATATQERRRPGARTALENLALAGDWTATGLPATIEGAIRSGRAAATLLTDAS
jgi:squalene-associated FAD-dependent desaturase